MCKMLELVIVDDEPMILKGLKELFPWEKLHYHVAAVFKSPLDCLEYVQTNPVDVILSDVRMPGITGITLAQKIQAGHPHIHVVLLSAHADFEYAQLAMQYGVKDYLVKPVKAQNLIDAFNRLYHQIAGECPVEGGDAYQDKIAQYVNRYVRENPATASLSGAAEELGYTPGHLSRLFHNATGATFSDYLGRTRMEYAAQMLLAPQTNLEDAAFYVGYDSVKHFSKAFEKHFNMLPEEYQLKGGEK